MRAGFLAVAAAFASSVAASGHHAHQHVHEALHLERDVLLVKDSAPESSCDCSTVWVTETGAPTLIGVANKTSSSSTTTALSTIVVVPTAAPTPTTSEAPAATYVAPAPVKTTPAVVEAIAAPSPKPISPPSTGLGSSGDQWAVTYTPYAHDNGDCLSAGQVLIDIALIALKGFSTVRIYSTDCNALQNVGTACEISGLKMILGVFISDTGIGGAQEQVSAITAWAKWELVELIVVGNEAIFGGYCSASQLASFISSSKAAFSGAGYGGPCTTSEPLDIWQESAWALCDVVDVVASNIHAFFNADVTCDQAGSFVATEFSILSGLCAGKAGIITETGWPSAGVCNGKACPGPSEQATAVASLKAAVGGKSAMFSFANDLWKPLGPLDCEQSWGLIDLFPSL